jgi:hypothetical protein
MELLLLSLLVGICHVPVFCFCLHLANATSSFHRPTFSSNTNKVVGIVLGFMAVFVVSYYAKKEFNKIVSESEQHNHQNGVSVGGPELIQHQQSDEV